MSSLRANGSAQAPPDDKLSEAIQKTRKTSWIASSQGLLAMTGVILWKVHGVELTGAETLDVARDAIWTIVVVSSPLMIVGLVVGVVVSLFQALTQIQEQTLVFVPKILAIFVTLLLALPFMADSLHGQMMRISSRIIGG
jgi:flagellar biosynthesis protein FliQ